jgi:KDO2-lipid IV(A) lauroyltransferase
MALTLGDPAGGAQLGRRIGQFVHRASAKHRDRAQTNIAMAYPRMTERQVRDLTGASFEHFGRLLMEVCLTPRLFHPGNWSRQVQLGDLAQAPQWLNAGKPAIMLTGHLGNWEVLGYLMAVLGYRMHAVARPIDNPKVNDWLLGIREQRGMRIITKWNATDRLVSVLDEGGVLGFIADQNAGDRGTFVPFFGRLASTYKSIALLAVSREVPVFCGYAQRVDGASKFEFGVGDAIWPGDWADHPDPVYYVTARYMRAIEQMVRRHPEQYLWMHRRWKSRPRFERQGEPMPESLKRKLASLPWLTGEDIEKLAHQGDAASRNRPKGV